jgi:uncharacterized repeat protein (TIGR02543 family)
VVVRNSTFTGNFVSRGNGGNAPNPGQAQNGRGGGAAIFSLNGDLSVLHCTLAGNEATGYGGGIVVVQDDASAPVSFTLHNTILANNGPRECSIATLGMATSFTGNLIEDNDTSEAPHPFDAAWSGCGGVVTSEDPGLGSLQNNQGPTPTMAIPEGSPAEDAADAAVGLPTDQRGQERPIGGYDIGAFELCLQGLEGTPCLILSGIADQDAAYLTMQVSPEGTGTTFPRPGVHKLRIASVVGIIAQPSEGYRFVNWTGDVTNANSAFTSIIMDADKTVTANFELKPDFSFSAVAPLTIAVGGSVSTSVTVNANAVFDQTVALSAASLPLGWTTSFDPTSVTPAPGGSASSQMTLSLGPAVLSGLYGFSVIGTSGSLVHTAPVSVNVILSPQGVAQVVGVLVTLGCIDNAGVGNAFNVKLAQAEAAIAAGDIRTAINLLTALLEQLQAQAGKHLETSCTDAAGNTFNPVEVLIDHVTELLASLV